MDFAGVYSVLGFRTELEELLEWDEDLLNYLIGAWSTQLKISSINPLSCDPQMRDLVVGLCVGCLPNNREYLAEKLEKWMNDRYTLLVEHGVFNAN